VYDLGAHKGKKALRRGLMPKMEMGGNERVQGKAEVRRRGEETHTEEVKK